VRIPYSTRALCLAVVTTVSATGAAQPPVTDQLEAFLDFEEGSGPTAHDGTGNGHHGTMVGNATWGSGYAQVHSAGAMIQVATSSAMRGASFTYDLWLEANGSSLGGRFLHQGQHVGGEGPDILEWYGKKVSFRITKGGHAVFDSPLVGSLTTPSPPNHLAQCDDSFHIQDGPEHLVFAHDGSAKRVRVFQGREGQPLVLTYDGTYSGSYSVSSSDLTLGNVLTGDRPHPSLFYQFGYYRKVLGHTLGGNGQVTGGEVLDNHLGGSSITMGGNPPEEDPPEQDAGAAVLCDDLLSDEFSGPLVLVDLAQGDPATVSFHVQDVPDPTELDQATLSLALHDADHPGQEGMVYVNDNAPLDLPAELAWDDEDGVAELTIPVAHLVEGTNVFSFGAGTLSQTYYQVGKVALTVEGPICDSADQPPSQDGGVDPPSGGGGAAADPAQDDERLLPDDYPHGLVGCACTSTGRRSGESALGLLAVLMGVLLVLGARTRRMAE